MTSPFTSKPKLTQLISPLFLRFCAEYKIWLAEGAPEREDDYVFERSYGLCSTLDTYITHETVHGAVTPTFSDRRAARNSLGALLRYYFDEVHYPFGGRETYEQEQLNGTMHLNPLRIAFIDHILKEYG